MLNPRDATGTRTPGGSNRIPAQFCGVVGMKPTFGLVPRTGVIPTWPYLDTHGPLARTVADAALMFDAIAGPDASDPLALVTPWRRGRLSALRADALRGARLGRVDGHLPLAQMTRDAQAAWHYTEGDLIRAGATVDGFIPSVTRWTVREQLDEAARARGDVAPNANSPGPTANALLRYFARQGVDARRAVERGLAPFRAFYDVLPAELEAMMRLTAQPMGSDAAGRSFARSRATVVARLADSFRTAGIDAMVYPTMPFAAPRAVDPWPDVRTPLGYGNSLGLPEVSVPAGLGSDGMPTLNLSFVGLPGSDARLLALAHSYEQQSPYTLRRID